LNIQAISFDALVGELLWLHDVLTKHVVTISQTLIANRVGMPLAGRRTLSGRVVPYPFGVDLLALYSFGRGTHDAVPEYVLDTFKTLTSLLFSSPATRLQRREPAFDWSFIEGRPLATILRGALGRARIAMEEATLNEAEAFALSGVTLEQLEAQGVTITRHDEGVDVDVPSFEQGLRTYEPHMFFP